MHVTIQTVISDELTRRLRQYQHDVEAGKMDRETANHRYLALQTALWIAGYMNEPATKTTQEEAREEVQRFIREINRDATVLTMYIDGHRVKLLEKFLNDTRPAVPAPIQTTLI
jgi:hypothetical protein